MKRFALLVLSLVAAAVSLMAITVDEVPNVHRADARRFVSNPDGVLSDATVAGLDRMLGQLMEQTTAEVAVVAVDNLDPTMTAQQMALAIQRKWGVGKSDKNNGLVVLVARDDRQAFILTGRGLEGIIPDVVAGRVYRDIMVPAFKEEDYDAGVSNGVSALAKIIADPANRDEILSTHANNAVEAPITADDIWQVYQWFAGILLIVMAVLAIATFLTTRRLPLPVRYGKLREVGVGLLVGGFLTLGLGLVIFFIYYVAMRRLRTRPRRCERCGHKMKRLSEEKDNEYLTPAQDLEEQLKSVDYDVWLCPECGEVEKIPFVNRRSAYRECSSCHARASVLSMDRQLRPATARRDGAGERIYTCRNCGHLDREIYTIPRRPDNTGAGAAAAGAILGGMMGGGGGGFSGGSFGGGSSAGGGAGGSW